MPFSLHLPDLLTAVLLILSGLSISIVRDGTRLTIHANLLAAPLPQGWNIVCRDAPAKA